MKHKKQEALSTTSTHLKMLTRMYQRILGTRCSSEPIISQLSFLFEDEATPSETPAGDASGIICDFLKLSSEWHLKKVRIDKIGNVNECFLPSDAIDEVHERQQTLSGQLGTKHSKGLSLCKRFISAFFIKIEVMGGTNNMNEEGSNSRKKSHNLQHVNGSS